MSRWCSLASVTLLLGLLTPPVRGATPEGGIGITAPPDSVVESATAPQFPLWWTPNTQRFAQYLVAGFDTWVDRDIDLLIDGQFGDPNLPLTLVTDQEAEALLTVVDVSDSNRFGWSLTDLAMTYEYFAKSTPYAPDSLSGRFRLYPGADTVSFSERNHVDIYLTPARYEDLTPDDPVVSCGAHPCPDSCIDADEDGQLAAWHWNALSVTDNYGNRTTGGFSEWPLDAAVGVVHEFTHLCWESNTRSYGLHTPTTEAGGDYNELLACASEYLAVPRSAPLQYDLRYVYSVLHPKYPDDIQGCGDPNTEPAVANDQRYALWRLFGAYLGYQFHDSHPDSLQRSLISRWARNVTDWGGGNVGMERTFCGLARILDNDSEFGDILGYAPGEGYDGGHRVSQLFSNYGIARWVDFPVFNAPPDSQPYYFGPDFSPFGSAGQFDKIDAGPAAIWEYAIPPEFVLDGDNVGSWTSYPAPCPGNPTYEGWYDDTHDTLLVYAHDCVPIQVDLWGSNYLVFRADTLVFGTAVTDTLVVQFDWIDDVGDTLMNPHVELWLSALTYSASVDSLFLKGNRLILPVETEQYRYPVTGATVRVPNFKRNANEAVVIVLTLVAGDYSTSVDWTYGCLNRRRPGGAAEPCVDLHYSYRFRVRVPPPPQGCPFVSSRGADGYTSDNNVLYAARPEGEDVLDAYLLSRSPDAVDGAYHMRLTETEDERTRFDSVELLAVDHAAGTRVATAADGGIRTYRVMGQPVACRDQDGNDLLGLVLASDDETATIEAGGWLDVVFPSDAMTRSGGGIEEDGNPDKKYEELPPPGGGGRGEDGVLSLEPLCYRTNKCVSVLDLPDGVVSDGEFVTVRVTAPTEFHVDRLSLVKWADDPVVVTQCALSEAQHSASGLCSPALASTDGTYATLAQGDTIDMTFRAPAMNGEVRDFVLLTRGGEVSRGGDESGEESEAATATISPAISPNPFNPSTTISFAVPAPGGRVAVSIYSMAGRLVRRLIDAKMPTGEHAVTWDGRGEHGESLGSGVYFCRIEVPGQSEQKKLVLLK